MLLSPLLIRDLSAWYRGAEGTVEVFQSVSFEAKPGSILGIFGPNGCGKTTLLRVIAGLNREYTGSVALPHNDSALPPLATIPQDYRSSFFGWANLQHNLELTSDVTLRRRKEAVRRIEDIRNSLELELDLTLRPRQCSGGMLQQAAIIRAFVNEPRLVLADEPFSALDVSVAGRVRRGFCNLVRKGNITALVVIHQLQDIVEVCDSVLVIPSRPFSTKTLDGFALASIIENEMRPQLQGSDSALTFLDLAQRVMSAQVKR